MKTGVQIKADVTEILAEGGDIATNLASYIIRFRNEAFRSAWPATDAQPPPKDRNWRAMKTVSKIILLIIGVILCIQIFGIHKAQSNLGEAVVEAKKSAEDLNRITQELYQKGGTYLLSNGVVIAENPKIVTLIDKSWPLREPNDFSDLKAGVERWENLGWELVSIDAREHAVFVRFKSE